MIYVKRLSSKSCTALDCYKRKACRRMACRLLWLLFIFVALSLGVLRFVFDDFACERFF